jgi:hypothetical protein
MFTLALLPRTASRADPAWVSYFGAVRRVASTAELRQYIHTAARERLSWLLIQLEDTSAIIAKKYRYIRCGIALLVTSVVATTAGILS